MDKVANKKNISGFVQNEVLRAIADLSNSTVEDSANLPKRSDVAAHINRSTNHVGNVVRVLMARGYVEPNGNRIHLTESGHECIRKEHNSISTSRRYSFQPKSTSIRVYGEVKAGRSAADDLAVYLGSTNLAYSEKTIDIPGIKTAAKVFALIVRGNSMVSEGIFNGDYVIVEQSQLHTTGLDGLLLIVRYLPRYSNIDPSTATEDEINANLEGPSLKYVRILEEREGLFYRLGIRSLLGSANQQIEAKYIVIEGRVIGIYRQIIR